MSAETSTLPDVQPTGTDADDWRHAVCRKCDTQIAICGKDVSERPPYNGLPPEPDRCPLCMAMLASGIACNNCGSWIVAPS